VVEINICCLRKKTKQESREWHTHRNIKIKRTTVSMTAAAIAQRMQAGKSVKAGELREGKRKGRGTHQRKFSKVFFFSYTEAGHFPL